MARLDGTAAEGVVPLHEAFDASGSSESATGAALTDYRWDFGDGSPEVHGPRAEHVYDKPGDYVARLTVADSMGRAGTTTLEVHAKVDHNVVVGFGPLPDQRFAPTQLVLDASYSRSRDPDAQIVGCTWTFDDGSPANSDGCTIPHPFALPGNWHAQVTVTTNDGYTATGLLTIPVEHDPKPVAYSPLYDSVSEFGTLADGTRVASGLSSDGMKLLLDVYGYDVVRSFYAANATQILFAAGGNQVLWLLQGTSGPELDRIRETGQIDVVPLGGETPQQLVAGPNGIFLSVTDSEIRGNYSDGVARWSVPRPAGVEIDQLTFSRDGGAVIAGVASATWDLGTTLLGPGPFLLVVDGNGRPEWVRSFGAQVDINWASLGVSATGTVVALGQVQGTFAWDPADPVAKDQPFLLTAEADGRSRWLRVFDANTGTPVELALDPAGQAFVRMKSDAGFLRIDKWNLAGDHLWTETLRPKDAAARLDVIGIGLSWDHTLAVTASGAGSFDVGGSEIPISTGAAIFTLAP